MIVTDNMHNERLQPRSRADQYFYANMSSTTAYVISAAVFLAVHISFVVYMSTSRNMKSRVLITVYGVLMFTQYTSNIIMLLIELIFQQNLLIHDSHIQEERELIVTGILVNYEFIVMMFCRKHYTRKIQELKFEFSDYFHTIINCLPQIYEILLLRHNQAAEWCKGLFRLVPVILFTCILTIELRLVILIMRSRLENMNCSSRCESIKIRWKFDASEVQLE